MLGRRPRMGAVAAELGGQRHQRNPLPRRSGPTASSSWCRACSKRRPRRPRRGPLGRHPRRVAHPRSARPRLDGKDRRAPGALGDIAIIHDIPDVLDLRIIPTVGIGIGAFSAAMAYQQVIDQLKNQPGGAEYGRRHQPAARQPDPPAHDPAQQPGSARRRRVRPLRRAGEAVRHRHREPAHRADRQRRASGTSPRSGFTWAARTCCRSWSTPPIEYQPLSDLASWPNPFTLLNNLAAGLVPTYMLRGLGLDGLTDQLTPQLAAGAGRRRPRIIRWRSTSI